MSAGTAYSKRYAGGFVNLPTQTTAIDSTYLNAVETALLQLLGAAPTVDGQVAQWDFANTRFGPALLLNKNVDPAAAIASSKIDFTGGNALTNAAIAGAAAIARSKLDFGSGLVNADVAAAAAIAYSKLNLTGAIQKADLGFSPSPVLYRKTTAKTVNTTVSATDLLNGEITIGAGVMGASGIVRLTAWGDWLQNSGGTTSLPRFQLAFGGTTQLDTNTVASLVTSGATRVGWRITAEIMNSATGVQWITFHSVLGFTSSGAGALLSAFTTGEGTYSSVADVGIAIGGAAGAIDTTAAKALVLNVINASASATYETKLLGAAVEVI